jgi:hypothetical protein
MMHLQQQQKRIDQGNAAHRCVPRAKEGYSAGRVEVQGYYG